MIGAILGIAGPIISRIVGGHHLLGKPIGALQTAAEGLGLRFGIGFFTAAYLLNDNIRGALNTLAKVTFAAIKGAVL